MTTGVLLFAFNNDHFDYLRIAAWNCKRIHEFLNLPVAVVTNVQDHDQIHCFDHVIYKAKPESGKRYFEDVQSTVSWYNLDRSSAWEISPFDRTLVLDVDYVVNSQQLLCLLNLNQDFVCHRHAIDAKTGKEFNATFGRYNMPMYWATVMCYQRSKKAETVFTLMQMIQKHWQHYRELYQIDRPTFRNDHALSIALNIESGQFLNTTNIPWSLLSVMPSDRLSLIDSEDFRVDYQQNNRDHYVLIKNQDFHAMGKSYLENIIANHS